MRRSIPMKLFISNQNPFLHAVHKYRNPLTKGHTVTHRLTAAMGRVLSYPAAAAVSWGCTVTITAHRPSMSNVGARVLWKKQIQIADSINGGDAELDCSARWKNWPVLQAHTSSCPGQQQRPLITFLSRPRMTQKKRVICNLACFRLATGWD